MPVAELRAAPVRRRLALAAAVLRARVSAAVLAAADLVPVLVTVAAVEAGLPCPIVSAGGTGSFQITGTYRF